MLILKFRRFNHLSSYVDTTGLWGLKVRFRPTASEGLSFSGKKHSYNKNKKSLIGTVFSKKKATKRPIKLNVFFFQKLIKKSWASFKRSIFWSN